MKALAPIWSLVLPGLLASLWAADIPARAHANAGTVVIVTSSAVDAFGEAVRGIRSGLGPTVNVVVVDLASDPIGKARGKDVRLLIAVGNNALDRAGELDGTPILATMLLDGDLAGSGRRRAPAGAVVLDTSLGDILTKLASALPGKTRVGIIRNPASGAVGQQILAAQAKAAGMTLRVVECPRPEELLRAFLSLRGQVDFVICPPDGTLYNSTTVRPLILASLDSRLPVVGFSESFARSGAVAAVFPDYFEVGSQAAELARKFLEGGPLPDREGPRKLKLAVNPRVARLLGVRLATKRETDSGIVVIE
jgi:hypothetical protein